jgi:sulfoxide reductase catalytic subunit YedY
MSPRVPETAEPEPPLLVLWSGSTNDARYRVRKVHAMGDHGDQRPDRPLPDRSSVSPATVRSFRSQLTVGGDVVDPATWAGSVPQATGIAPRVRIGRSRWFNLLWLLPIGFIVLIAAVAAAKGMRGMPAVQGFIERYAGTVEPAGAEQNAGLPLWLAALHFFNLFLLIFIIRSGLQILSDHPRLYWTAVDR